jgi:hypothetical protein
MTFYKQNSNYECTTEETSEIFEESCFDTEVIDDSKVPEGMVHASTQFGIKSSEFLKRATL